MSAIGPGTVTAAPSAPTTTIPTMPIMADFGRPKRGRPPAVAKIPYVIQGVVNSPENPRALVEFDIYDVQTWIKIIKLLLTRSLNVKTIIFSCLADKLLIRCVDHFDKVMYSISYNVQRMARYYCAPANAPIHFGVVPKTLKLTTNPYTHIKFAFIPSDMAAELHMAQHITTSADPKITIIPNVIITTEHTFGQFGIDIHATSSIEETADLIMVAPLVLLKSLAADASAVGRSPYVTMTYSGGKIIFARQDNLVSQPFTPSDDIKIMTKNDIINQFNNLTVTTDNSQILPISTDEIIACSLYQDYLHHFTSFANTISNIVNMVYIKSNPYITLRVSNNQCSVTSHILTLTGDQI